MDTAAVVDLGRQALWITMLISAPLLGISLIVGVVIGILQSIQRSFNSVSESLNV